MVSVAPNAPKRPARVPSRGARFVAVLWKCFWLLCVVCWPVLKWVISLDVAFHLARMFYFWDTPGMFVGWTFSLHFAFLTLATYFVSTYRPKG